MAAAAALPLAACGSDTSLLSSGLADPAPLANTSLTARPISRLVAFRPPVGPPESVNGELARQLNDAAIDNGVALVTDASYKHDVMLRGYVTALRKGTAVNLTYLWDVLDARGQRINRFEGEEALTGMVDLKEPWSAVTPAVARAVAQRTMADVAKWLRTNPQLATPASAAPSMPSAVGAPPAASLAPPAH